MSVDTPREFRLSSPGVVTSSKVKRWWLTTFKGYELTTTRRTPQGGLFGSISYRTMYILLQKKDGEE